MRFAPLQFALAILLSGGQVAAGSALQGRVIRVMDGDTVEILVLEESKKRPVRIRLSGIDAPEKKQPFGEICRKALADRIAAREVSVEVRGTDRYSRTLGVIVLREKAVARDINLEQVAAGCAWHYRHYAKQQPRSERRRYAQAELSARRAGLGLWKEKSPQPPWEFRRMTKKRKRRAS